MNRRRALVLAALSSIALACRGAGPSPTAKVDAAPADTAGTPYSAATVPIPELGYNAREGRAVYRHYCLNCHGDEGAGDGFNAYNLDPRPQSLADSTFQATHSDADLVTAIKSGGPAVGLSNGMPPWGRTLNQRQIDNLVEYLRTLPAVTGSTTP